MNPSTNSGERVRSRPTSSFNGPPTKDAVLPESPGEIDSEIEKRRELVRTLAKQANSGINDSAKALDQLMEFSASLSLDVDPNILLNRIVEASSKLGIAERVLVVMRENDLLETVRDYGEGGVAVPSSEVAQISETLVRKCLRTNEIDVNSNIAADPRLREVHSITELDLRSSVCVPLRARGDAIGVLYLDSKRHLHPSDLSIRLLSAFAGHASLCLTHRNTVEDERRQREKLAKELDSTKGRLKADWRNKMIGRSTHWRNVIRQVEMFGEYPYPVLILGETGSGKEVVAQALYEAGIRARSGPLVQLDCTGLPENLQESSLFGTVKGAFTSSVDKPGFIEEADGGTLFLDELGDMPPLMQSKLLRFLESGQFHRVGSTKTKSSDVRIIAATNRPLAEMIETGAFRSDLYFRLKGVSIEVPPLRKRMDDVPLLADHFLAQESALRKRPVPSMTSQAERVLMSHRWPGNVRELKRVMQSAVAQALFEEEAIDARHIRAAIKNPALEPAGLTDDLPERLEDALNQAERAVLERALRRHNDNTRMVALDMGVTRQTIYNLKRKHGID